MSDDNHFAALRSAGWSRTEARQILRDAAKGDPVRTMMQFAMFGRI